MERNAGQDKDAMERREFIRTSARLGAGLLAGQVIMAGAAAHGQTTGSQEKKSSAGAETPSSSGMPMREFGKTGVKVSALGLGGHHVGTAKDEADDIRLIQEAVDSGITFMDNAWDYHMGGSETRMGKALKGHRDKVFLMTKVCTHGRGAKVAMQHLEDSLKRLQTDHLDLWQIHEVAYHNDPELHFAEGGVAEALLKAKEQGKVRFLGFTGHKHPDLHLEMLRHDFPFDAVQMPLNVFDATFLSFEQNVLPELQRRGIAPIAMKSFGGTAEMIKKGVVTAEEALRYVLSLPVAVTVSGMNSGKILEQNLAVVRDFKPMSPTEMENLRERMAPMAADGRFELFKTTAMFDGNVGREQHGFRPQSEMPL